MASAHSASSTTWDSKTRIQGNVTIAVGEVVTVAPKSIIQVAAGAKIVVAGTLLAPSGMVLTGKNWSGLEISGLAQLSEFEEFGASSSFRVTPTGKLEIHGGKISGVNGASSVEGTLIADHLHYDKGDGAGITADSGKGSIVIDQSILTGSGRSSGDFFSLSGLKSINLTNSKMSGSHCAFHVTGVKNMSLNNVQISDNAFGFMMYGSDKLGIRNITQTVITNNDFGFDEGSASTRQGKISISQSYIKANGKDFGLYTGKVKVTAPLVIIPKM